MHLITTLKIAITKNKKLENYYCSKCDSNEHVYMEVFSYPDGDETACWVLHGDGAEVDSLKIDEMYELGLRSMNQKMVESIKIKGKYSSSRRKFLILKIKFCLLNSILKFLFYFSSLFFYFFYFQFMPIFIFSSNVPNVILFKLKLYHVFK